MNSSWRPVRSVSEIEDAVLRNKSKHTTGERAVSKTEAKIKRGRKLFDRQTPKSHIFVRPTVKDPTLNTLFRFFTEHRKQKTHQEQKSCKKTRSFRTPINLHHQLTENSVLLQIHRSQLSLFHTRTLHWNWMGMKWEWVKCKSKLISRKDWCDTWWYFSRMKSWLRWPNDVPILFEQSWLKTQRKSQTGR